MQVPSSLRLISAAGLLLPLSLSAQEQVTRLDPIVVTPSRNAETADQALASVTVISREEIEQRQAQSVLDLLRMEAGIDMARTGGPGSNTSLFLRGTASNHTLVLVDGVRASSGTSGQFAWQHLDPSRIDRIEIVRGPRASLYGSDAIGGVIQIFTRQVDGPRGRIGAGSNRTRRTEIGYGGGDTIRYGLDASYLATDGFPSKSEENGGGQEDHGYRNRSVNGRISAPLGNHATISGTGWLGLSDVEYDSSGEIAFQETRNSASRIQVDHSISGDWYQVVGVGYAEDLLEDFGTADDDQHDYIRTRRTTADWRHHFTLTTSQTVQIGLDYVQEETLNADQQANSTNFDETLANNAAYAQWQGLIRDADVQIGLRRDEHGEFGGETTGQLAIGVPLTSTVRGMASFGTAFNAPTANQLYHPGFFGGFYAGNPDLDPETSRTGEIGLRYRSTDAAERLDISVFQTRIDDLIAYEGENLQAINIDQADIQGVEISHHYQFDRWSIGTNATLQRAIDLETGDRLLRRPDEKASLILGYQFDAAIRITLEGLAVGSRPDRSGELPGYGLVNLGLNRDLGDGLRLEARVENLFDRDYELAGGYNTQGLVGFVGVSWEPGR